MNEKELMIVITDHVDYLLEIAKVKHAGNCLLMSQFVQFHLELLYGIRTKIQPTWVSTEDDLVFHYFVEMRNKRIIDPTASQFKGMPKVYIGERPKNYLPCKKNK
jgi:hypothetical protein